MTTIVRVTDDTTHEDFAELLDLLNTEAKAIRRRGFIGTRSIEYAVQHDIINAVLSDMMANPATY